MSANSSNPDGAGALFERGLSLYRQGDFASAAEQLDRLLAHDPNHFDALHLQGLVAGRLGRAERAVDLIERAIHQNARVAAAHRHLGNALAELGRYEAALASYAQAIALRADFKEAFVNRAMVLLALKRPREALADFDRALALGADEAIIHTFRGAALIDLNRACEAAVSCTRALELKSDFPAAHVNRAAALYVLGRYEEALEHSQRAIELQSGLGAAHAHRGAALYALRRLEEALRSLDAAIALDPQNAFAHNLRALCLLDLQRPQMALASCTRAIELHPASADAHNTRGLVLTDLEQFDAAMASFAQAIALDPALSEGYFNQGIRYLQTGDFARGWDLYERRPLLTDRVVAGSRWDGTQEIAGRTVFVYAEQGLGDTLQFCRYAMLLKARGAQVVLSVQDTLRTLVRSIGPDIAVIGSSEPPPGYDYHCPLLSLPRAFGTRLETIPAQVPYLAADARRVSRWRTRLEARGLPAGGRWVGIRWQGRSAVRADAGRSFPLRHFEALASVPGIRLVSLQKDAGAEQLAALPRHWRVEDLGAEFEPGGADGLLDVAAVMECLDLVITSDTSIAHLAGALARPTWVVLKQVPDWRWMLGREDSPWYPTMRLFRQASAGDWEETFARMRRELELHLA